MHDLDGVNLKDIEEQLKKEEPEFMTAMEVKNGRDDEEFDEPDNRQPVTIDNPHFHEPVTYRPGQYWEVKVDSLLDIFGMQRVLMDKLGVPALDPDRSINILEPNDFTKILENFTPILTNGLSCEITEFLDEVNWKPWRKTQKPIDLHRVQLELVDAFHFLLELMIIWGMDAKKLFELYCLKNAENHKRQERGY